MSTILQVYIDAKTIDDATAVLDTIGLSVSDALRLMMIHIATEKSLPFEPLIPNQETIAAMEAAERGELVTVGTVDGLLAELNADDWTDDGLQTGLQARNERPLRRHPPALELAHHG